MPKAKEAALETVDLLGVEIMATGGPIHGVGSPPEGDTWTTDDLRAMADAATELKGELQVPAKIGHSDQQQLLKLSGITDGELPAAGWIENQRVSDDGERLLADFKNVPKKLASLINAGGYRTRSAELSKITSQKTKKTYDWVVTGVAWLGGKMPAVRTLDDAVKLYHGDGEIEVVRLVTYGDAVAWNPDDGLEAIRSAVREALNPGPFDSPSRYWVRDVSSSAALVTQGYDDDSEAFVVAFTRNADGSVTLAQTTDWQPAEQVWIATAKSYAGKNERAADTRPMPEITLDEKAQRALADELKLEDGEELTPERLLEAVKAAVAETSEGGGDEDGGDEGGTGGEEPTDAERKLEARVEAAEKKAEETAEKLRLEERRYFVDDLVKAGKIEPGEREKWETRYDKDSELAREFAQDLEVQPELVREYGVDDDTEQDEEAAERAYEADAVGRLDIPKDEVI